MQAITLDQWRAKERHGYTSMIDGERHALTMGDNGGTCLAPVRVVGLDIEAGARVRVCLPNWDGPGTLTYTVECIYMAEGRPLAVIAPPVVPGVDPGTAVYPVSMLVRVD